MTHTILLDELEIHVKRLTFVLKGELKVLLFVCDNYNVDDEFLRIYLNDNLIGLIPIKFIDMESILYE